jgi:hypothetical protein
MQGKIPMRHPFSVHGNEFAAGGTNRREFIKIITGVLQSQTNPS